MQPFSIFLVLPLLCAAAAAQQVLAVSPADRQGLEGSSFTHLPLGRADARMQTLHSDVPGGTLLSGHGYRRDAIGVRGIVPAFSSDLAVALSMSPRLPAQAATSFASNQGASPTVVLPRTFLAFPATDRPSLDPAPAFDLVVPYQVPFLVPPSGGTLCVDVTIFGNQSAAGPNQNLSIYLDAHENYTDGRAEQPGFRTGLGCPAPGQTAPCYAQMTLWRLLAGTRLDVSIRDGMPDPGTGVTWPFVMLGTSTSAITWPGRTDCTIWGSADVGFLLPGTMNGQGAYDGSLLGLPMLPPGYRLWCQAGSISVVDAEVALSDATTLITPPQGPLPIPTSRIANSTDHTAATGVVSYAVPVMCFF
ncbi:MAG TPA: hypothetical protein VF384_12210 [Planctomycetota bacterium]